MCLSRPSLLEESRQLDKRAFYGQRSVSQSYDKQRFGRPGGDWVNQRELSIVASFLPAHAKVLDMGCGTGRASLFLADLGYEVVGLDASSEMLAVAQNKTGAEEVDWVLGDVFDPPFGQQSFDAAIALRVAFHYSDLHSLLANAARILRKGGTAVLDTYNWSPRALADLGRGKWGPRIYVHRPAVVEREAGRLGLEVVASKACFLFSPYLYALLPRDCLGGLERIEQQMPAHLKSRVFWHLRVAG